MRYIIILLFTVSLSFSTSLKYQIGQMLMVGFFGTSAPKNSQICKDIKEYHLGGVILFDYNPINHKKAKNISTKYQLKKLTKELQDCSYDGRLLIAVDQEGGKVQRLKRKYGFYGRFPKASDVKKMDVKKFIGQYEKMAKELKSVGVNYNLAPVVDLDINPKNYVIHKLGRSYGNYKEVRVLAYEFIDAMHKFGILTSLKHFPGHGSSIGDTHKGFVDVTPFWKEVELDPFHFFKDKADSVMVAHVFNKHLDKKYPASLSYKTITKKLRGDLDYHNVVITDDLQMGAINKHFSLKSSLQLAINAGNDILLFGNQLSQKSMISTQTLVNKIFSLIEEGRVEKETINKAFNRVQKLKRKL